MRVWFAALAVWLACFSPSLAGCVLTPISTRNLCELDPGWSLTFDEEFNGTAVNTRRWGVPNGSRDTAYNTYSNVYFSSALATVSNGILKLGASFDGTNFHAASLTSYFQQAYGYFEARLKPPCNAHGVGAGFWMDASGWTFPEIDVLEWLGVEPALNHMTWHYNVPQDGGNVVGISSSYAGFDLCTSFHVYGVAWQTYGIYWYIDGHQVAAEAINVNSKNANPLQIILNTAFGGFDNNLIDSTTVLPATYEIDYVHVYSAWGVPVLSDFGYGGPGDAIGSGN